MIVEDEPAAARLLKAELHALLSGAIESIRTARTLTASACDLCDYEIDLLFLDLDLFGEDGFDLLRRIRSKSFQTIIVSANTDRALRAFEFGVLDFVPKPLDAARLSVALARYEQQKSRQTKAGCLSVQTEDSLRFIPLENILYVQADLKHSIIALCDGEKLESRRSLKQITDVLPRSFIRVHKSFVVRADLIEGIRRSERNQVELLLRGGTVVPAARRLVAQLKS
jgi:DNA-binding LytR/AlgR family response regulator